MSECSYCGKDIDDSNYIRKDGNDFCNNLCRYSFSSGGRSSTAVNHTNKNKPVTPPRSRGGKPTIISLVSFVVTLLLLNYFFNDKVNGLIDKYLPNGKLSQKQISEYCSELNESLPMMLDKETEIYTTIGFEGKIQYHYRIVNFTAVELDTSIFMPIMRENIRNSTCSAQESRDLLEAGVSMEYVYHDKNKVEISRYTLHEAQCPEI